MTFVVTVVTRSVPNRSRLRSGDTGIKGQFPRMDAELIILESGRNADRSPGDGLATRATVVAGEED